VVAIHGGSRVIVAEEAAERERELTAKRRKKLGED